MTNYNKLIAALRCDGTPTDCSGCLYDGRCSIAAQFADAADAIEMLTAENERIRQNSVSHETFELLMADKDAEVARLKAKEN